MVRNNVFVLHTSRSPLFTHYIYIQIWAEFSGRPISQKQKVKQNHQMESLTGPDVQLIQIGGEYQISKAAILFFEPIYPK